MSKILTLVVEFLKTDRTFWSSEKTLSERLFNFLKLKDSTFNYVDDYKSQLSDGIIKELKEYKCLADWERQDVFRIESEGNFVIYQPFGSQCKPDIMVIFDHEAYFFEHKSSKTNSIMWNSSYAVKGGCYSKYNTNKNYSTFFNSNSIITETDIKNIEGFLLEYKNLVDRYNINFSKMDSKWNIYDRAMFTENTKFGVKFKSEDSKRELSTLQYIQKIINCD